jgi:hypothetical protein
MSTAIAKNFQVGSSPTATNNFTIFQPATPDGTLRIGNGNTGITTSLLTLTSAGNLGLGTSSPLTSFGLSLHLYNSANTGTVASNAYLLVESANRNSVIELSGSASSTNGINFSDTPGTTVAGIASTVADQNLLFRTGGTTERMRIDSSGNVGIGTSSPGAKLEIGPLGVFRMQTGSTVFNVTPTAGATDTLVWNTSNSGSAFAWNTNSTERMRLDSSGNLGLGVAPSAWDTSVFRTLQIGTGAGSVSLSGRTDGAKDMILGSNIYYATSNFRYVGTGAATIYRTDAGAHTWNTAPSGTAGNAISFTQAMTLDASGNLMVGKTSAGLSTGGFQYRNDIQAAAITTTSTQSCLALMRTNTSSDLITFFYSTSLTQVGSITTTGSATAYNTSSDYRLKNITGPITNSGAYIDSLNPVEGTWKADGSTFVGLIAHEVQEASRTPVATGTKDGEQMQGMDYSSAEIIANLIAELKSLRARVAALETN